MRLTPNRTSTHTGPRRARWLASPPLLLALLILAPIAAAQAQPTCNGRSATIVSNAAKIVGTKAPDVIVAGPGDNVIYGEGGDDTICGGEGDDSIYGGRGDDSIFGEGGNDSLYGERGSDDLNGGSGTDRLLGSTGNDSLSGGPGDRDRLEGGPGDDTLDGGEGDFDLLIGGPGNDGIDGGPGAHDIASYAGAGGPVTIDLGSGTVSGAENEHLSGIEDAIGGPGNDSLSGGGSTPNRLDGGPGDDQLNAVGPGDEAFGGPGSDQCGGGFAAETSCGPEQGGAATMELYESIDGTSTLIVTGTNGPDDITINDAEGASSIQASLLGGNDTFTIGSGVPAGVSATIDGGKGSDTLRGGAGDDVLYGGDDDEPDTLEGGGGDDVLYGVNLFHPRKDSGAATMLGGPGDDLLIGGQPCDGDLFDGGPGDNDSASFARVRNSGTSVEATIGGAVLDPDVPNCNAGHIEESIEKIEGSPGNDILAGDEGPNTLLGRGGDDRLDGKGGFDDCAGGGGSNETANCEYTDSGPRDRLQSLKIHKLAVLHRIVARR
jgi:Ca2+-binding RTX toxin-like protein